ncbi:MAG: DoxX family protein [Acidobacteriia bacterium]|nr:DoxX family protein [Terriglobia bacterium]
MTQNASKLARTGLQWSLGLVLIYECSRLVFTSASAHSHMPRVFVVAIAAVELLGAILFLIPPVVVVGGRMLLATFGVAAVVHILHGQPDVGYLVIYAMAVLTITTER